MNKKTKKIIIISLIIVAIIVVGLIVYFNVDVETVNEIDNVGQVNEIVPEEEISDEQLRETTVNLYFLNENNEIAEEVRIVDSKVLIQNPYKEVMNLLLNGPKSDSLKTVMPKDTRINNITKNGECLTIDFSKEFIDNADNNLETQSLIISQITNTMTQFTEINAIKILIDGAPDKSFKDGNISFQQIFTNED